MINGKKILGVIPAKANSKGLPGKNIKLFAGEPLIYWTINSAKNSKYIDNIIVSSEDPEIIKIANGYGISTPFVRPIELTKDDKSTIDVIIHAVEQCPEFDLIVVLQPTSPLRRSVDIDKCIEMITNNSPFCVSVTKSKKTPFWMYKLNEKKNLVSLFPDNTLAFNRQELPITYELNGAVYVGLSELFLKEKSFINDSTVAYIMASENSVDIDDSLDFYFAEYLFHKLNKYGQLE